MATWKADAPPYKESIMVTLLPKNRITADIHMHTCHSHGQATTTAMFEAAVANGLHVIGFSEHSPRPYGYAYASDYQDRLVKAFPLYISEVLALKKIGIQQEAEVLLGVEIDYITGHEEYAKQLRDAYPYDYTIGGLHFQGTWGFDATQAEWNVLAEEERFAIYRQYYKDLACMCETRLFNIAAHPDLVKIFSIKSFHRWLDTPEALPPIENALLLMRDTGMAMEVSSAGLRKPCNEIYPGPRIMELAQKLHVPISFASDAHCTSTPAYAFAELASYARNYGYATSLVYKKGDATVLPFTG